MAAYVILDITVNDPAKYEDYKKLAPPAIEAYGGKYLVRGGLMEILEGDWKPNRIVILEFQSIEMAKNWINSPEYSDARALRHQTATSHAIVVDGL
jgi:uncharacterized protein (DUF1330 family)